ncbi:MAG: hypothetical protein PHI12_13230, partial [Dehalococcoidales bacterium]|nr:hypothetical protein [Dehalococcoidales bacterium]
WGGGMKSVFLIFCSLFLMFATPKVFSLIDDARTDEYTETFAGISTAAGVYSANFTLAEPLYYNSLVFVEEISSNATTDVPSAASYNTVSRLLTVNGLDQSLTRTLSVTFLIESATIEDFMLAVLSLLRWFYLFLLLGTAAGSIYCFFTS